MNDISVRKSGFQLTSFNLRVIALATMFMDHAYKLLAIDSVVMELLGRLAFPIFAFQIVEGYLRTKNYKKYAFRMFIFALISEIPYNIMYGGLIAPYSQNVLWTLLIGLITIRLMDGTYKNVKSNIAKALLIPLIIFLGFIAGFLLAVDYLGFGVLLCVVFYLANRYRKCYYIIQFVGMIIFNYLLGGIIYKIPIFGSIVSFPVQFFAMFSLPLIWLYKGKQGYHSKWWSQFCYWFYPLHILVIYVIFVIMNMN